MRSAEAAKNTAAMIEESVQNARNGVTISTEVAKTLEEITGAATKVNALVGEIAAASREQAQGIEQVNTAIGQMDKVTQSNAASAEESASAAEEMSSQAEQLHGVVNELVALVGGTQRNTTQVAARSTTTTHGLSLKKASKPAAGAKPSPAQAIPLGESAGAGFGEFKSAA